MVDTGARRIYSQCVNSAIHEGWSPRIDVLCGMGHWMALLRIFKFLVFFLQFLYDFETLEDNLVKAVNGHFLSWARQRRWTWAQVSWAAWTGSFRQICVQNVLFRWPEFWKALMWSQALVARTIADATLNVIPLPLSYLLEHALMSLDFVQLYLLARILTSLILWMLRWHHPLFLFLWPLVQISNVGLA